MAQEIEMTLVATRWYKGQGMVEVNRRTVKVIKRGRWLVTRGGESFDPKTLRETRTSSGGVYRCRLEPIQTPNTESPK